MCKHGPDFGKIKITVRDTTRNVENMKAFLRQEWCSCSEEQLKEDNFLCYPEDGCCTCGEYKHHVHCKFCGGITQTG